MSVTVNGFAQHLISYYSLEDAEAGRLREPSTIPELAALEISPEYLHETNFRFPPQIPVGEDGLSRNRGYADAPQSPQSPGSSISMLYSTDSVGLYDCYHAMGHPLLSLRTDAGEDIGSPTAPVPAASTASSAHAYCGPSLARSSYFNQILGSTPPVATSASLQWANAIRFGPSTNYAPYGNSGSPETSVGPVISHHQSQLFVTPHDYHYNDQSYDIEPNFYYDQSPQCVLRFRGSVRLSFTYTSPISPDITSELCCDTICRKESATSAEWPAYASHQTLPSSSGLSGSAGYSYGFAPGVEIWSHLDHQRASGEGPRSLQKPR